MDMIREIVFDTETTGFNFSGEDRIVEIGCVEMLNHTPTGKTFHVYINPERNVPVEVVRIHGLDNKFLADKPIFANIVDDFLEFIGNANLVAHNAMFDMNFINAELRRIARTEISLDRMVDTLTLSRKKNPHFARHDLNTLCTRYNINNSHRELHGALLDARLLTEVYIELLGGKEVDFFKVSDSEVEATAENNQAIKKKSILFRETRNFPISKEEEQVHNEFVKTLGEDAIWLKSRSIEN